MTFINSWRIVEHLHNSVNLQAETSLEVLLARIKTDIKDLVYKPA